MENLAYLHSCGVTDKKVCATCLEAMEKYGSNKWWEPDADPRALGYYQLHEPIMLVVPPERFRGGLEALVGRKVFKYELLQQRFKDEAKRAWCYGIGCTSDAEREKRYTEGVLTFAEEYDVPVIFVELDDGKKK